MQKTPQPTPEGALIASRREQPPRMSIRQAAKRTGISEARWRQIEHGVRYFRGQPYPESGPAPIVARMAATVGVTAAELTAAGRADAAAELVSQPDVPVPMSPMDELRATMRRVEELRAIIEGEEGNGDDKRMAQ